MIRDEWAKYYSDLYNWDPKCDNDKVFEAEVNQKINEYYDSMPKDTHLKGGKIEREEVITQVKTMKNRKAPGHDNITAEHFKHLGENGTSMLTNILNCIIENECIPDTMKKGLLCPIPKPGKNPMFQDCNRGVTLLCAIYKLLEKILIAREKSWFNDVRCDIQGAGVDNCSSLHTSMMLQEVMAYNRNKGETVYTVWKDIHKAFDHVWIEGLLYKLYKLGINGKTWRLIRECYSNFQCSAFIGGTNGPWFPVTRGVHQGAPLSMILYEVFINDLLIELRDSRHGIQMFDIDITCPTFADDIASETISKTSMNALLNIVYKHSITWRYSFSYDKCNAMITGPDECPNRKIKLGNEVIECKKQVKHVGIIICKDNKDMINVIDEKVSLARKYIFSARGLGSYMVPVSPRIMSKLYWSVAVPKFTYGLELCVLNDNCINTLEEAHRKFSKIIQMLPISSPNPSHIALLGWLSMSSYISMKKVLFMWRILSLPCDNIYRRIVQKLISCIRDDDIIPYVSPIYDIYRYVCSYGLQIHLKNILEREEIINYTVWKRSIKTIVWSYEFEKWKATCMLYPELNLYRSSIETISMHMWWYFVADNPIYLEKASAVLSIICSMEPKRLQRNFKSNRAGCLLCKERVLDDYRHIFIFCPKLLDVQNIFWQSVRYAIPDVFRNEYDMYDKSKAIEFLLSGFKQRYNNDWVKMYCIILDNVYIVYQARAKAIDSTEIDVL